MSDTPETPRRAPRALTVLAGIAIVFLLLAGLYVGYQTKMCIRDSSPAAWTTT